jgi:myo-inositol-1(or 4)-monophosphatase
MDGTSNFASGVPWFGVLISVFKNNTPFMGGAYLPVQDTLIFAQSGKGAFKNGKRLPMLSNMDVKDTLVALNMDYTENMTTLGKYMEVYENVIRSSRNLRSTNSLIDFIYVAEGKFGGVINLNTRVWDISAFYVIIQETGGKMLNINGNDLEFSLDETIIEKNFPVVAGTDQIIKSLIFKNI